MQRRVFCLIIVLSFAFAFQKKFAPKPYKFPELTFFPKMPSSSTNPVQIEGVNLGRYLFYDPILSLDSSISCASCHKQQFAFSDSPNSFSKGIHGILTKRNVMPLFNLAWYPVFFWDGRANSIEEQILHPVRDVNEMNLQWKVAAERLKGNRFYNQAFKKVFGNNEIDSSHITNAIGQFLRTLISYQSKYDRVLQGRSVFTQDEDDGFVLVNEQTKGDCIHCHVTDGGVLGTTLKFSNNGLDAISNSQSFKDNGRGEVTGKSSDNGKFMIPSLRNVGLTAPYMHDGRFKNLEEVLDFYSEEVKQSPTIDSKMEYAHRGGVRLTKDEKKKIISFLHALSDSAFIVNKEFDNPFIK